MQSLSTHSSVKNSNNNMLSPRRKGLLDSSLRIVNSQLGNNTTVLIITLFNDWMRTFTVSTSTIWHSVQNRSTSKKHSTECTLPQLSWNYNLVMFIVTYMSSFILSRSIRETPGRIHTTCQTSKYGNMVLLIRICKVKE